VLKAKNKTNKNRVEQCQKKPTTKYNKLAGS